MAEAALRLERAGVPEPHREAQILMGWLLGLDRGGIAVRKSDPIDECTASRFADLVERREKREPRQYLFREEEFRGLVYLVDPRVLIPRPETELLVDAVLAEDLPSGATVLDLGTGSGCIATALAVEREDLDLVALDLSPQALEVARENARRHGVAARIRFEQGDLSNPPEEWAGRIDAIVSNPPYVSESEWATLAPEVREYEPKQALVPGPTGSESYEALAPVAFRLLRPEGLLVLELGYRSDEAATAFVRKAGFEEIRVLPDLRGIPRVLVARHPDRPRDPAILAHIRRKR